MAMFKKGAKPTGEEKSLIEFVVRSREAGISDKETIEDLKEKGYSSQKILDAMKKADLKHASGTKKVAKLEPLFEPEDDDTEEDVAHEAPAPTARESAPRGHSVSEVEELAEKIIEEKWVTVKKDIDALKQWKDESIVAFGEIKTKMEEITTSLDLFKKALSEKIAGYSDGIKDLGADIKAMDMVFKQILPELTSDVKELSSIVGKFKSK